MALTEGAITCSASAYASCTGHITRGAQASERCRSREMSKEVRLGTVISRQRGSCNPKSRSSFRLRLVPFGTGHDLDRRGRDTTPTGGTRHFADSGGTGSHFFGWELSRTTRGRWVRQRSALMVRPAVALNAPERAVFVLALATFDSSHPLVFAKSRYGEREPRKDPALRRSIQGCRSDERKPRSIQA